MLMSVPLNNMDQCQLRNKTIRTKKWLISDPYILIHTEVSTLMIRVFYEGKVNIIQIIHYPPKVPLKLDNYNVSTFNEANKNVTFN